MKASQQNGNPQPGFFIRGFTLSGLLVATVILTACRGITSGPIESPIPPTSTLTPTATFVFPTIQPTETATSAPLPSATPDLLAELGSPLFIDPFSEDLGWPLIENNSGATSRLDGQLLISLREPQRSQLVISPAPAAGNYYLETKLRAQLCNSGDEFGLVFRVNSFDEHYRFLISCNGEVRMSRVLSSGSISLIPAVTSEALVPGPLIENTLGVLANGDFFRFWVNGVEVFSVKDTALESGSVGLIVKTGSAGQLTVSSDDFFLREINPTQLTTATAAP
jgi:hypothetical protein